MRAQTRDPLQTLKGPTSSITSLDIPPDTVEIIAGSSDGHVRAWDMRMGKVVEDCVGGECCARLGAVRCFGVSTCVCTRALISSSSSAGTTPHRFQSADMTWAA